MKALITGFEPYGPWQRNPSGETVMYTTLHHIATRGYAMRAGFIHASPLREEVPDLTNGKGMRLKKWIDFTESVLYLLRSAVAV